MQTLILCGGRGTRARPHTLEVPKPLIAVGDSPILRHVMDIYARQGVSDFILAAGYRAELISAFAETLPPSWRVEVVDSGEDAGTARRIASCSALLGESFFVTYGDGLGDVDLSALSGFHASHEGVATVTTVPLPSPYGTVESADSGRVARFIEKPQLDDHWINAGFFVFDRAALAAFDSDDLEREVLPRLAQAGQLYAYRHRGFWRSMDTYKDAVELTAMCRKGVGPWTAFPARECSSPGQRGSSAPT